MGSAVRERRGKRNGQHTAGKFGGGMQLSWRSTITVKHYFAILGWTVGVWLAISISFSLSFPGAAHSLFGAPPGPTGLSSFAESLVLHGPMCSGMLAFVFGLLGWLPGTDPKDDVDKES